MAFTPVDPKVAFPELEQQQLAWWRAHGVIEQSELPAGGGNGHHGKGA